MKRYFYSLFISLVIFLSLIFFGCKKDEAPTAPQNHLPKIESLTANPATVLVSTETTITCIATDENGDNLTISWSAKRGSFKNGTVGVAVIWVAPSSAGKDTITATVNDGKQTLLGKLEIVVGTVPANPTLSTPTNNAIEVSLSPTLTWNVVGNTDSYTLQVSTSSSFSNFVYNQSSLTNTSKQIGGLSYTTKYYWRVSASNNYGTSGWASYWGFTTIPLQVPTLLLPVDNSTNISITPTLSWNASTDAISYTLQITTDISFSNFVYNQSGLTNTNQQIQNLNYSRVYYWRVNSTINYSTSSWSNPIWSFTTLSLPCPGLPTMTYLGKIYHTVLIGNQCWLKENLDIGTMINGSQDQTNNGIIEKYCYNDDPSNCNIYGGLYQWNEAMQYAISSPKAQGICPTGWHIPNDEFITLTTTVNLDGNALKTVGQGSGGTNTSGFSALLAGIRRADGYFVNLGIHAYFWNSVEYGSGGTEAGDFRIYGSSSTISSESTGTRNAFSIRCVKD